MWEEGKQELPCRAWVASAKLQGPATARASELHSRQKSGGGGGAGAWALCSTQQCFHLASSGVRGGLGTVHSAGQSHRCFSGARLFHG